MRFRSAARIYRFGLAFVTLVALSAAGLSASQVSAAIYYVRTSGNDSNNGLTPGTAFKSIDKASAVVTSGDTVYVGAGTYVASSILDDIQKSSAPLSFIADTDGAKTGDFGAVIISNKMIGVVNCNYVEFHGFDFKNATIWPVVWKGSYGGLFQDCAFDGGSAPLLIKDGSVKFERCEFTNFDTDAIYVDGEANVELVASTISDCKGDGIEITKAARVILSADTKIQDNEGDGIRVAQTATYIDDGGVGPSGGAVVERLVAGKFRIRATKGSFDGYDSSLGPYGAGNSGLDVDLYSNTNVTTYAAVPVTGNVYIGPSGSTNVQNLTGTVSSMEDDITMAAIDVGDAATNNNNANIPLTDFGYDVFDGSVLDLSGGDGMDLPAGTYYLSRLLVSGGAILRLAGPTTIFVTDKVSLSGGSIANPTQKPGDLKLLVTGSTVSLSGSAALQAAIYAPNARITMSGSTAIYGMAVANDVICSSTGGIHLDKSLTTYAAEVQGLSTGASSPSPPAGWNGITQGEVEIYDSKIERNRRAVNIETALIVVSEDSYFRDNDEWGLCVNGPFKLANPRMTGNGVGGIWMKDVDDGEFGCYNWTIGDNPEYAVYLENCHVAFNAAKMNQFKFTSGSEFIFASQGGSLTLDGVLIDDGSKAAVYMSGGVLDVKNGSKLTGSGCGIWAEQSAVTITKSELSGNDIGLYAFQCPVLTVTGGTELISNAQWGAKIDLTSTTGTTTEFSGVTVSGNATGIAFVDATGATVKLPSTSIQNNTSAGLAIENSNLTLDATTSSGLQITNNVNGINSLNSTLTLDGLTISGQSNAAVYADGGTLTVNNSTLSNSGYGISASNCDTVTLDNNCTLSGNSTGLYASQIADLQVKSSTFTDNTTWGANVNPKTGAGLCVIFDDCIFEKNVAGLTVVGAVNGQLSLQTGTMFRDNTNAGLHFANCNLTVNDQIGGTAWQTLRNGYGISSTGSTLTLYGTSVEESAFYGVRCEDSSVSLASCTVTGVGGIFADSTNDNLTVDSTTLTASSSGGWGVVRHGGNLDVKNCVLNGFDSGVYLSTASVFDQAAIKNSTLVNLSNNGVQLHDGDATVQNTILVGSGATFGLMQESGQLTHSHNLLFGFGTPFSGTAADASELLDDPGFADAANGDFTLAKASPAINAGTDLTSSGVTLDMSGAARPSHKVFEIGAYEYTSNAGSLRVLNWKEER